MGLTVAVTGPTGEIGTSVLRALEQERRVDRVLGMARRPFDPASRGWRTTEYRQGDVLDRAAVAGLVAEADVVVHLAYVIVGSREESQRINLAGTRNVFEATVSADRPHRLVYTSSLAAYGYHVDNPVPLTGDGEITMGEFARALGGYAIPVPGALVGLTSTLVERLPFLPPEMEWVHTARHPMLMDTTKARRELGWAPAHTAHETLTAMVDAERDRAAW